MPARFLCLAWVLLLTACVANPKTVSSLTSQNNGYMATDSEKKLIAQADEVHQEFLKQGLIVSDPAITQYLADVTRRFTPSFDNGPSLHYYVLRDATLNAMALPNGNIYINAGLFERLESEDQLALVLAHETAHVIQRHSYKGQLDRQNTVVAAHITDLLLGGTGIAYLPFALNLASFSREQEQEADLVGIGYLNGKGYDLMQSVEIFDKLQEVKHQERGTSAWASHPDLAARKKYSIQKISMLENPSAANARSSADYDSMRRKLAGLTIQLRMLNGQYELARDTIDYEVGKQGDGATWHIFRGDAWREAAEHPDAAAREYAWLYDKPVNPALTAKFSTMSTESLEKAADEYATAVRLDPNIANGYRGIGLTYYRQNNPAKAREFLQRYLALAGTASDRRYIENIMSRLAQP